MPETDSYITIRIYIKPEQHGRLKELASADELSVSWLIRRAIDEYLAQHAPKPTIDE